MNRHWMIVAGGFALLLSTTGSAGAQAAPPQTAAGRISGSVTARDGGQPLTGVQVTVVGTRLGAVTAADGRYTIVGVAPGRHPVRAQRIGFTPQIDTVAVAAGQAATIDFRLASQAMQLTGVVTVGYGTQARRDVTGAVASVSSEQITAVPATNALDAIKGRVPGVDITSTGYAPGAGVNVRIRGARSITATNDPLYVLDGIPLSGAIGDLNPNDIESMEVLKDASATAIYGSRGANGVVLITSRKGNREGGTRITYDGYVGAQRIINPIDVMNGEEFAEYKREAYRTAGKYTTDQDIFFPTEYAMLQAGQSTDWQELILRDGLQASNQIAVRGGGERIRFAISANQLDQKGITRGQDFVRQSAQLNFDHDPSRRLRLGASTLITRSTQQTGRGNSLYGEALQNSPLGPVRDSVGRLIFKPTPDGQRVNPLSDVANFIDERVRTRAFGTLFAEYDLLPGLSVRSSFGPDISYDRRGRFRGTETFDRQGGTPDALDRDSTVLAYTLDNILRYSRDFGRNHRAETTLLYSVQSQRTERDSTMVSGLPYEHQQFYNLGSAGTIEGVGSGLEKWSLQSYMARVNYQYRDRYLLTLTSRVDGSSRLAPGRKYGVFPSLALGWQIGDESFMRDVGWLSQLKLRASYGRTGNTGIDPYRTQGALARTSYQFGDGAAYGYRPGDLANSDLQWETTDQFDVGIDFGVLNSRISGSLDYYNARTSDLLLFRQLPPNSGFLEILQNVGTTRNTGVELALTTVNVDRGRGGFRWESTVSWAANRNKIVALAGGGDDPGSGRFIGQPIEVFFDYKFDGIWQTPDSALARRYGQTPGQIRVVDQNDDGTINDLDRVVLGDRYPDWIGSLNNQISWRGLDLSVLATARRGVLINSEFHTTYDQLYGRYNNLKVDYWTPTNSSNTEPRPNRDQELPLYGSSRAYKDGSFVRVRNISLGYALPGRFASRAGAQSARLYFTAQDPFLFTDYTGYDPESGAAAGAPSYRTLLVGLGLGF